MSDGWTPPSASLASRDLRGGLWDIRHVLSTYCVPGIVFDTSPPGGADRQCIQKPGRMLQG